MYFCQFDFSAETPKFDVSAHFHGKTTNSAALLNIAWACVTKQQLLQVQYYHA